MTDDHVPGQSPIVDTHVHLWNLAHPTLRWSWVDTNDHHPILGDIDPIKMRAFEMKHLKAEARFAGIEAVVHVQAAIGSPDRVEETRWLTNMANDWPQLRGIVGHVVLGEPGAEAVLDRHGESALFRGVRDFAVDPYLASGAQDPTFEASLALLARRRPRPRPGLRVPEHVGSAGPGRAASRAGRRAGADRLPPEPRQRLRLGVAEWDGGSGGGAQRRLQDLRRRDDRPAVHPGVAGAVGAALPGDVRLVALHGGPELAAGPAVQLVRRDHGGVPRLRGGVDGRRAAAGVVRNGSAGLRARPGRCAPAAS